MVQNKSDKVREIVAHDIGYIACISATLLETNYVTGCLCQLHQNVGSEVNLGNIDILISGFFCPQCDKKVSANSGKSDIDVTLHQIRGKDSLTNASVLEFALNICQSLFSRLLFSESSKQVQVTAVGCISRLLCHAIKSGLLGTKPLWIKCLEILPLYEKKAVRRSFCLQIHCFIEKNVMDSLFEDDDTCNKTKEENMLGILKHALAATEDLDVFETLLETVAEIMKVAEVNGYLFFFSFALLIDQLDNSNIWVRATAAQLIHKSAAVKQKGRIRSILSKFGGIRDELFEYMKARIVTRPIMVSEFAEAILGIPSVDIVREMVLVVLPNIVVLQQQNNHALETLHELTTHLNASLKSFVIGMVSQGAIVCVSSFKCKGIGCCNEIL